MSIESINLILLMALIYINISDIMGSLGESVARNAAAAAAESRGLVVSGGNQVPGSRGTQSSGVASATVTTTTTTADTPAGSLDWAALASKAVNQNALNPNSFFMANTIPATPQRTVVNDMIRHINLG